MKALPFIILLTAVATAADINPKRGDELIIGKGRVYRNWSLLSETAATVTIQHAKGATTINKADMPEPYRSVYPVDPVAVAAEATLAVEKKAAWDKRVDETTEANRKAFEEDQRRAHAREAARRQAANRSSTKTRTTTMLVSPRTAMTESIEINLPPDSQQREHVVDFVITGPAVSANVRYGKLNAFIEEKMVNPAQGWREKITARTGEQVSLYVEASNSGGQSMWIELHIDGVAVRKQEVRGQGSTAHLSYAIR